MLATTTTTTTTTTTKKKNQKTNKQYMGWNPERSKKQKKKKKLRKTGKVEPTVTAPCYILLSGCNFRSRGRSRKLPTLSPVSDL